MMRIMDDPIVRPKAAVLARLANDLTDSVSAAYLNAPDQAAGSQPLRKAFEQFGHACAATGTSLEHAMAVAAEALQSLLPLIGGRPSDAATTIAAGIALAAVARSYQTEDRPAPRSESDAAVQVARLDALHQINRASTANAQLSNLLETTVAAVVSATASDACAVFLYDAATDALALRAALGLNPASVGAVVVRAGLGITGQAAQRRTTIVAPFALQHESYLSAPFTGDAVYASQVSVPMVISATDQLIGVLNVLSVEQRHYDADEVAFLETVAGELAITIETARMYNVTDAALRRKIAELGTLQRVSRTVVSSLDLPDVLRLITEAAVELIDAEAAAIFRLPRATKSGADEGVPTIEYRVGETRQIVDEARRDDLVLEVIDSGTARVTDMDYVDGSSRLFCLPLQSARETWGALCLRLPLGAELREDELGLLQAFTDSASLAIENAQLYREARHSVETASTLLQEMHHRVRNNLQTVAALLSIQMRQDPDGASAVPLREAASRIQAIASVHDLLSDESRLNGATLDAIARLVAEEARSTIIQPTLRVTFDIPPSDIEVPSKQATVLALLTNELVANAVNHGFRERTSGVITIRSRREGETAHFEVENDGEHVPDGFDPTRSTGLGMRIVQRLVTSDLHGSFAISSTASGTVARISFPLDPDSVGTRRRVIA